MHIVKNCEETKLHVEILFIILDRMNYSPSIRGKIIHDSCNKLKTLVTFDDVFDMSFIESKCPSTQWLHARPKLQNSLYVQPLRTNARVLVVEGAI